MPEFGGETQLEEAMLMRPSRCGSRSATPLSSDWTKGFFHQETFVSSSGESWGAFLTGFVSQQVSLLRLLGLCPSSV